MILRLLLTVLSLGIGSLLADDALLEGFRSPPRAARPFVWWHWMNGNVSKEGITADLEAMAAAGIGGAQIFDVSDGIPPGRVAFNSDLWFEMLRHANDEAKRLGIELCLANCSGWSSSGGPWVTPEDAEKDLVFAETHVRGGATIDGTLPRPENPHGFYRDLRVLAFPRPMAERIDARDYGVSGSVDDDGRGAEIVFAKAFPLTGVALRFTGGGRHPEAKVSVAVEGESGPVANVRSASVYPTRYGFEDDRIFIPAVAGDARRIRVSCTPLRGVRLVAVEPVASGRIAEERAKTFFIRSRITNMQNPLREDRPGRFCVQPERIVDLTALLGPDGRLTWTAPADAEEWTIVRFGFAANGARCRPPTPAGDGLEVDKFSKAALGRFFRNGYVDRALKELGPVDPRGGFNALIVDSFEVKSQNWTEGFEKIFSERKGYDLTRFLPVFTGRLVGSVRETDVFLTHFREVAGALFVENYAAEFHRLCRERGLQFYLEGYGSAPCADLRYARHCDVPMGEFWAGSSLLTGNCRFAGSVAHVWGHRFVASESFTTAETGRWTRDPFAYKAQGDRAYCAGINRIIYHRWAHQPWTNPANYPGMTMGPHGSHFERTQTWWDDAAAPWLAYQSRCQWMLQQGVAASDLLVVVPNRTPSCGLDLPRWHEYDLVSADRYGRGLQYDLCDQEALSASTCTNGQVVVPSGAVYRSVVRLPGEKPPKLEPAFDCADPALYKDLRWIHRQTRQGDDLYFVALPNRERTVFEVSFRETGRRPEVWDPESGRVSEPVAWREAHGRTFVTLSFDPSGSAFVVFRPVPTAGLVRPPAEPESLADVVVDGPWTLTFLNGRGAPSEPVVFPALVPWNEHADDGIRHYSGSAVYEKTVPLPAGHVRGQPLILDLGEVRNVAVVTVNGKTFPVLWRPPFRLDVAEAVGASDTRLRLSVKITNLWPNRLIGDDALPCDAEYRDRQGAHVRELPGSIVSIPERLWKGESSPTGRHTFTTWRLWKQSDRLLPSGLIGPVCLRFAARPMDETVDTALAACFERCWSPRTSLLYGCGLSGVKKAATFTNGLYDWYQGSKEGYGSGMGDCAIIDAVALSGCVDRWAALAQEKVPADDPRYAQTADWAAKLAKGLLNLASRHGYAGFVARGLCEEDGTSICSLSSIDQHTHWVHGLYRYSHSPMARPELVAEWKVRVAEVAARMERTVRAETDYNFGLCDGRQDPRGICRMWWPDTTNATASCRLPSIYAAAFDATGDRHWKDLYERLADKACRDAACLDRNKAEDPKWKWRTPTYSLLQMNVSLEVLLGCESDPKRRADLSEGLRQSAAEADFRAKDMWKNPGKKWYGMAPDAELALAQLTANDVPYDATELQIFRRAVSTGDARKWWTLKTTHLFAAYWRARLRGLLRDLSPRTSSNML